jgi:hypothetical protein
VSGCDRHDKEFPVELVAFVVAVALFGLLVWQLVRPEQF